MNEVKTQEGRSRAWIKPTCELHDCHSDHTEQEQWPLRLHRGSLPLYEGCLRLLGGHFIHAHLRKSLFRLFPLTHKLKWETKMSFKHEVFEKSRCWGKFWATISTVVRPIQLKTLNWYAHVNISYRGKCLCSGKNNSKIYILDISMIYIYIHIYISLEEYISICMYISLWEL